VLYLSPYRWTPSLQIALSIGGHGGPPAHRLAGSSQQIGVDLAIWCLWGCSRNLIQVRATRTPTRTYRDWENEVGRERLNIWFEIFW
jgi:hypothetical protein